MRIIFSGHISRFWMSGAQRLFVLRQLGVDVVAMDQGLYARPHKHPYIWWNDPFPEAERALFRTSLLELVATHKPDVVWLEWPRMIEPETLEKIRACDPRAFIVSFQDDNPFGHRSRQRPLWRHFIDAIPTYDLHLVKRSRDLAEFAARGARRVELFEHGTVPELFRPQTNASAAAAKFAVSFVGTPLDRRVGTIARLQLQHRLPVHVFGNRWNRTWPYYLKRTLYHPAAVEGEYVATVWNSKISLGFVSHSNGDEYSMRSYELPACGAFFLAERSPRHQALYREGIEADFFSSAAECADKIKYYLSNDEARSRIAVAGCRRAHLPENSLKSHMSQLLAGLSRFC